VASVSPLRVKPRCVESYGVQISNDYGDRGKGDLHAVAQCESVLIKCFNADPRWLFCFV
jgi:hypothetical protein